MLQNYDLPAAKRLACKQHSYTHFHLANKITICKQAGVLSDTLNTELGMDYNKYRPVRRPEELITRGNVPEYDW